jgi:hypothetical protein
MFLHFILFAEADLEYRFLVANDKKRSKEELYPPTVIERLQNENDNSVFNKISLTNREINRNKKRKFL